MVQQHVRPKAQSDRIGPRPSDGSVKGITPGASLDVCMARGAIRFSSPAWVGRPRFLMFRCLQSQMPSPGKKAEVEMTAVRSGYQDLIRT